MDTDDVQRPKRILPLIILAQLMGTSTWFAGNAILPTLIRAWQLPDQALAWVTNAVQLGFISGTLSFALLSLADRFRPSRLFCVSGLLGGAVGLATAEFAQDLVSLLMLRFLSGFLLAGIYPVGMKIATTWYPQGLGRALGYLVGALVLGTAAPHLFAFGLIDDWQGVMQLSALLSLFSGLLILLAVGEGPAKTEPVRVKLSQISALMRLDKLRASAFGYFGHMWELYAVWTLAPLWLASYFQHQNLQQGTSIASFAVIAVGALGCVLGGLLSQKIGSAKVASLMLMTSGLCCLLSPFIFQLGPIWVALFWAVWGISVIADSAQFSSLSAQNAPPQMVGTALTLINSVGFTLTLISIQCLVALTLWIPVEWAVWLLLPGPVLGVWMMQPLVRGKPQR